MSDTLNIFISYGRKDATPFALRLRDDLEAVAGWRVWLDQSEIDGGDDWMGLIERAIEGCDLMLALISPHANDSKWCKAEQLRAMRKGKPIVPLLLFAHAEPPLHLEASNFLDFTREDAYPERLRDLISDLRTRAALRVNLDRPASPSPDEARTSAPRARQGDPFAPRRRGRATPTPSFAPSQHRQAASLRRALRDLQAEDWGARQWWTTFAFHYADVRQVADILTKDALSAAHTARTPRSRFDALVRLAFRPRTPDSFSREGHRAQNGGQTSQYVPVPVYLAFELEDVLLRPGIKFSDGDPARVGKTYSTAQAFRDLPFERIYHDTWFSADEKDEILRHRDAQLLLPDPLGLEALQMICLRSAAEYDTLRHLLPLELWRRWRDKIAIRPELHLFHQRRPYIQQVSCTPQAVEIACHSPQSASEEWLYALSVLITPEHGQPISAHFPEWQPSATWHYALPTPSAAYRLEVRIEGELAYLGALQAESSIF